MKTMREIADELNVSKQAVYQHYSANKKALADHTKIIKTVINFDDYGSRLLIKSFKTSLSKRHQTRRQFGNDYLKRLLNDKQNTINAQRTIIAGLMSDKSELKVANQHLKSKNNLLEYKHNHQSFWQRLKSLF